MRYYQQFQSHDPLLAMPAFPFKRQVSSRNGQDYVYRSWGESRTVDAENGATVMETAIKNSVPGIEAECGGACACATCHVYVDEAWTEIVGAPSPMEEDMLDFGFDVKPNSRLSCQIKVTDQLDGLVLRTPERQA